MSPGVSVPLAQVRCGCGPRLAPDLPHRHPPRVQRQNLVIEASKARLALSYQLRLKAGLPVPRRFNLNRPEIPLQPLAAYSVAAVPLLCPSSECFS
jgi:hypothetical protein